MTTEYAYKRFWDTDKPVGTSLSTWVESWVNERAAEGFEFLAMDNGRVDSGYAVVMMVVVMMVRYKADCDTI